MREFAYCRVSDVGQKEDRQIDAVTALNIPPAHIFIDKQSGKNFERPAWQELVREMKRGDLLYVSSLDRLGRNYEETKKWWRILTKEQGVDICILDMPILDTRNGRDLVGTVVADVVLQLLAYCAENERNNIRKRQSEGIKSARKRGVRFGRPIIKPSDDFGELVKQWEDGTIHITDVLEQTGMKEATFYRRLREERLSRKE